VIGKTRLEKRQAPIRAPSTAECSASYTAARPEPLAPTSLLESKFSRTMADVSVISEFNELLLSTDSMLFVVHDVTSNADAWE